MSDSVTQPTLPFRPRVFRRQLWLDATLRAAAFAAVLGVVLAAVVSEGEAGLATSLAVLGVLVAWVALGSLSARVSRDLPQISALIQLNPAAAEERIAANLRRRPLVRWVRLMLYHRLAALRHRQRAYRESAAICQAILDHPLGPARHTRPHLLLMLAEARLQLGDPAGAFAPLQELYWTRLSLGESLQRLTLQIWYEVAMGYDAAALNRLEQKIELAELLPAPQCGAIHAMLASAARQAGEVEWAHWLQARAELLCKPEHLNQLEERGLGVGVVEDLDVTPVS